LLDCTFGAHAAVQRHETSSVNRALWPIGVGTHWASRAFMKAPSFVKPPFMSGDISIYENKYKWGVLVNLPQRRVKVAGQQHLFGSLSDRAV
jgi:hypothetical protein